MLLPQLLQALPPRRIGAIADGERSAIGQESAVVAVILAKGNGETDPESVVDQGNAKAEIVQESATAGTSCMLSSH